MLIYLNNTFVPREKAMVSVFDHGLLYGDGIFETLRAYRGRIFKCEEHIQRLFRSAEGISLDIQKDPRTIERLLYTSLRVNRLKEAYIRLSITRGMGKIGFDPSLCPRPTVIIISKKFSGYPRETYEKGVSIACVNTRRNIPDAVNPQIKSLNCLNNILAKIEAQKSGVHEGIMLTQEGYLCEGTVTNLFLAKKGTLLTPPLSLGILGGITRKTVIDLAREKGVKVKEALLRPPDLYQADECFLTNTSVEILPVVQADRRGIGTEKPGEITRALHQAFRSLVRSETKRALMRQQNQS